MKQSQILTTLMKELRLSLEEGVIHVSKRFEEITKLNASKGKLKSGQTIIDVINEIQMAQDSLLDESTELLEKYPLKHSKSLYNSIVSELHNLFPDNFESFADIIEDAIKIANGNDRAREEAFKRLSEHNVTLKKKIKFRTEAYVIGLKAKELSDLKSLGKTIFELICLAITLFLAYRWYKAGGGFEPVIVVLTLLYPVFDLLTNLYKRVKT